MNKGTGASANERLVSAREEQVRRWRVWRMCFFILSFDFKVNKHFYPKTFREEKVSASNKALPLFQWESFIPKCTGSIVQT